MHLQLARNAPDGYLSDSAGPFELGAVEQIYGRDDILDTLKIGLNTSTSMDTSSSSMHLPASRC